MKVFVASELALEIIGSVKVVVTRIGRHDRDLMVQARRAANSVALNVDEGNRRAGADRLHHFRIAAGSAGELRGALRCALAWGWLDAAAAAPALALIDRELAVLYRLVNGPGARAAT